MSIPTIRRGIQELNSDNALDLSKIRTSGGGRPKVLVTVANSGVTF